MLCVFCESGADGPVLSDKWHESVVGGLVPWDPTIACEYAAVADHLPRTTGLARPTDTPPGVAASRRGQTSRSIYDFLHAIALDEIWYLIYLCVR